MQSVPIQNRGPAASLRQRAIIIAVIGVVLIVAGIILATIRIDGATLSQWNGLCTSGIGEFAQAISGKATKYCGLAATAHAGIPLLIVGGIVALVISAVFATRAGQQGQPSSRPANAGFANLVPASPPPPAPARFCGQCGQSLTLHSQGQCPASAPG